MQYGRDCFTFKIEPHGVFVFLLIKSFGNSIFLWIFQSHEIMIPNWLVIYHPQALVLPYILLKRNTKRHPMLNTILRRISNFDTQYLHHSLSASKINRSSNREEKLLQSSLPE